jgi:hypothetical protein
MSDRGEGGSQVEAMKPTDDTQDETPALRVKIKTAARQAKRVSSGKTISWDAEHDGNIKAYIADGITLIFHGTNSGDAGATPVVLVRAQSGQEIMVSGVPRSGATYATAEFGIGKIDPSNTSSQVMLSSFSGWKIIDMGDWDDASSDFPIDIDGDGVPDFVFPDDRFDYVFGPHSESWMPPRIFNILKGGSVDVSGSGRYKALFEDDFIRAKNACSQHSNGACAGFVADAARLGHFETAWPIMLANYDKADDWNLTISCDLPRQSNICQGESKRDFVSYPEALAWFLKINGYR